MIVATHMGMYMPALRPDWEKLPAGEPELQVRSRRKIDLLNLRVFAFEHGLSLGEVIQLPNTDYQFRAYCTRETWGQILQYLAEDIDYTKFKDTPDKKHGDKALKHCYEAMWRAIFNAFPQGSIYNKTWSTSAQRDHGKGARSTSLSILDEPVRWSKRIERTETVEWKRISDMTDRELALFLADVDGTDTEPTDDDLAYIDAELGDITKLLEGPVVRPDGQLDHSDCKHRKTRYARKTCRRQWLKDNQDKGGKK